MVSGSRDATLRVWDIESGQCLHVLMGHVAAVRCVQYDGRRVVSGAYDFMVKVWDPETETCLHTLQGHTNRVYSLQVRNLPRSSGGQSDPARLRVLRALYAGSFVLCVTTARLGCCHNNRAAQRSNFFFSPPILPLT